MQHLTTLMLLFYLECLFFFHLYKTCGNFLKNYYADFWSDTDSDVCGV